MDNFYKAIEKALLEQQAKAFEILRLEALKQAMEIENPEVARLGADIYLPRLSVNSFGAGHSMYWLDSDSKLGQPIAYLPPFDSSIRNGKVHIHFESSVKTGAEGEALFLQRKSEHNTED